MNNNNNKNTNSGGGRKKGSQNKYTLESRKILLEILEEKYIDKLDKLVKGVDYDDRLSALRPFVKIICSKEDEMTERVREKIYKGVEEQLHPNRFRTYFNRLTPKQRLQEIRQWSQFLTSSQREQLFKGMR